MIIEKTYNIDEISDEYNTSMISYVDYQRIIIADIIKQCNTFLFEKSTNPVVVTGLHVLNLFMNQYSFFQKNIDFKNYKEEEFEYVGILGNRKIYLNLRLNPNQIIIGDNISDVINFINLKDRKQKLKKLQNV